MKDTKNLLFEKDGKLPALKYSLPMALQHLVAMIVGCVTPAIIISATAGLSNPMRILLIQSSLVCAAVSTLLQLFGVTRFCGARLPVIMGVSFAYLATMQSVASEFGIAEIFGAQLIRRHRRYCNRNIRQAASQALSTPDHRNRGIHNRSFSLSHRDKLHGGRHRKC